MCRQCKQPEEPPLYWCVSVQRVSGRDGGELLLSITCRKDVLANLCVCVCDCDCDVLGLLVSVGVCLSGRGLSRGLAGAAKEDEEPSSSSDALQQSSGGGAGMCGDTRSPFDGVANEEHHLATAAKKKRQMAARRRLISSPSPTVLF